MEAALNKLRIWKPALSKKDADASRKALEHGMRMLCLENGHELPGMKAVIWWLMRDAAETWKRVPEPIRAMQVYKVMWPDLARPSEDNRKIEWEIGIECAAGVRTPDGRAYRPKFQITDPAAHDRAETVYSWFKFVKAKNRRRDIGAFIALAEGRGSRAAAAEMGGNVTDYAVTWLKNKILRQIEDGLTKSIDVSRQFVYKRSTR